MKLHESFETNHEYLSSFLLLLAFERRKAAKCTFFPPNSVSHWRLFLKLATHFWLDREAVGLGRPIYRWQATFSHKLWLDYSHYIIFDHHARTHWRSQNNKTCFLHRRQCGWHQILRNMVMSAPHSIPSHRHHCRHHPHEWLDGSVMAVRRLVVLVVAKCQPTVDTEAFISSLWTDISLISSDWYISLII